ncbi:DUF4276 family protein [Laspinema olomoucense]|uniref:DUF4276 family protein n=1 Tax=Laspinema olomoucense D3b TaxID=2953688 RepID=A0ABT2NAN9_9CYAN|nr:DUF4276 family protein [Laspinema sp. D3b]MCT7979764.1 DUF4276 family protein [Laspinema sp. D3b]
MVTEIRLYIEGGGNTKNTKALLRSGFSQFFQGFIKKARDRKIRWNITVCGSRNDTYRDFTNALIDYPDACNILLVDSEGPVTQTPWQHLKSTDNWDSLGVSDRQCHLMVQAMEAWFIADIEALSKFYGQKFQANSLPKSTNIEKIPKDNLEPTLKAATRHTQKGEYKKIEHGCKLLALIDIQKVCQASKHCQTLFEEIDKLL